MRREMAVVCRGRRKVVDGSPKTGHAICEKKGGVLRRVNLRYLNKKKKEHF